MSNALVSAGMKSNDRSGLERSERIPVTRSKCTPVSNTAELSLHGSNFAKTGFFG